VGSYDWRGRLWGFPSPQKKTSNFPFEIERFGAFSVVLNVHLNFVLLRAALNCRQIPTSQRTVTLKSMQGTSKLYAGPTRLGTHYPCLRAVFTGRVHGRRSTLPVNTARGQACRPSEHLCLRAVYRQQALHDNAFCQQGPWTRVLGAHYPCSRAANTVRERGCHFGHP